MSFPDIPGDPAELAALRAEQYTTTCFEVMDDASKLLADLEHGAEELGFLDGSFFVEAHRGLIIPADTENKNYTTYHNFSGITFEGTFGTYGIVHIGRIIGAGAVRALCLVFLSATLMPYFDPIDPCDILYVPVLAVSSMQRTA